MTQVQETQLPPQELIERLDAIIRELQTLRQLALVQEHASVGSLTDQLSGALAPPAGREDEGYDFQLDWERFAG